MRVIQISEKRLTELFDAFLKEAKLEKLDSEQPQDHSPVGQFHRRLHYHACLLKTAIENEP